jgi:hypothetical protein
MHTATYYRIQSASRSTTDMLHEEHQFSYDWADPENVQVGVSVCDTLAELAAYLAGPGQGMSYGDGQ